MGLISVEIAIILLLIWVVGLILATLLAVMELEAKLREFNLDVPWERTDKAEALK